MLIGTLKTRLVGKRDGSWLSVCSVSNDRLITGHAQCTEGGRWESYGRQRLDFEVNPSMSGVTVTRYC